MTPSAPQPLWDPEGMGDVVDGAAGNIAELGRTARLAHPLQRLIESAVSARKDDGIEQRRRLAHDAGHISLRMCGGNAHVAVAFAQGMHDFLQALLRFASAADRIVNEQTFHGKPSSFSILYPKCAYFATDRCTFACPDAAQRHFFGCASPLNKKFTILWYFCANCTPSAAIARHLSRK